MPKIWVWRFWSRYSNYNARRHGRIDGAKGIPVIDQEERTGYEMELKQAGEELIKKVDQEWNRLDAKLKSGYCMAVGECRAAQSAAKQAELEHQSRLKEYETVWDKTKEAPYVQLNPTVYWIVMILIAIGEFPLNAIVFRLFGESEALTYVMSATLGVVLPFAAHFLGILLRKSPFREEGFTSEKFLTVLTVAVPLFVIGGVAYWREQYIHQEVDKTLTGVTLVFMAINLLVFLAAVLASYFAHDPTAEKAQHDLRRAKERLRTAENNHNAARSRLAQAEDRLQKIKAERENTLDTMRGQAGEIRDFIQRVISVYRTHNIRARSSQAVPRSFKDFPQIKVPEGLSEQLDWNCPSVTWDANPVGEPSKT